MTDSSEVKAIAEKYLKEMLEADDTKNFDLYTKCSGQLILATDLYSSQYLFSDSLGVSPPL